MRRFLPLLLVLLMAPAAMASTTAKTFTAQLSGEEEVPPVDTKARGQATFKLTENDTVLNFKLVVANIENVTQAHIHCGARGVNGPVVLWLYPEGPPPVLIPGRFDGILAKDSRTGDDVVPQPDSAACPGGVADFDDLLEKMQTGQAYVNVHTSQFPGGEIRGQIEARGPRA